MPVKIHNKDYFTVAERVAKLREDHPDYTIETQLISQDDEKVIMKALIYAPGGQRIIAPETEHECHLNMDPKLIATGYAEEVRAANHINQQAALEVAETSAVGRALAFFGYAGTEIASADEVASAITQQREKELYKDFAEHMRAVTEHYDSLSTMRIYLADMELNYPAARECWNEIPKEDQIILWRATTKGGWLTTREREQMKSNEWNEA